MKNLLKYRTGSDFEAVEGEVISTPYVTSIEPGVALVEENSAVAYNRPRVKYNVEVGYYENFWATGGPTGWTKIPSLSFTSNTLDLFVTSAMQQEWITYYENNVAVGSWGYFTYMVKEDNYDDVVENIIGGAEDFTSYVLFGRSNSELHDVEVVFSPEVTGSVIRMGIEPESIL